MKNLREKKFLTQEQVAQRVGVKQQYISQLEHGHIDGLTLRKLFKLAHIFNISPCKMLFILIRDKKNNKNKGGVI
jgi:transcriptional regulator with XRE-family HTH domain